MSGADAFGVYVHIPFCATRCDYCAFATWTDRHHLHDEYLDALVTDIARAAAGGQRPASSIFVGGGTPSMVDANRLAEVIASVPTAPGAEVTVECNPDDVSVPMLRALRSGGVTRISLGVQSMVPAVLAALGRRHDPANVVAAVDAIAEVGFESWNVDLIYGGAGESVAEWAETLEATLALDPPHVSAYALTVEAGTPLATQPDRHPDDDDQADKYLLADDLLSGSGREWYEISNWARPGHECRHNHVYWDQGDYRGFGSAAHSHERGRRFWNIRTPERYIAAVRDGTSTMAGEERLDGPTRAAEALQLAIRTRAGVTRAALAGVGDLDGLVEVHGERVVLTRAGRLLANEVAIRLQADVPVALPS